MIRHLVIPLLLLLAAASHPAGGALLPYPVDDQPAPALSLPDLGGTQHSLSAYRGNVVLVNFWATWCAPCLIEMPGMQRLLSAMKGRPFTILAVNVKEAKTTVWRFKNLLKVNFPALLDSDGAATQAWEVQFYPTSFLIDSEGNIRYTAYGMIDWDGDETRQIIEQLLPDGKAAVHETSARP
ncbi:MAG: TlpA disulfide reductase family protein [Gammaproteobacteria bacterium]